MARFSNFHAKFYDVDLAVIDDVPEVEDVVPISGTTEAYVNGAGETSIVFPSGGLFVGTLTAKPYLVCCVFYEDANRGDVAAIPFCEPFVVRSIVNGPKENEVTISGPSLVSELMNQTINKPIGSSTVTNTTIHTAAEGMAPETDRTVAEAAPAGNDAIKLDSRDGGHVGDEIRIELDDGNWHVSVVTAREPSGMDGVFQFKNKMPSAASIGNSVHFRQRVLRVATTAAAAAFKTGVECRVTMNGGAGTHTTLIAEPPSGTDSQFITMRDGLTAAASPGNAVQATDLSGKSTTDVTQILAVFNTWTASFQSGTGTQAGTRYAGGGDTVYDILRAIADETGEFFRLKPATAAGAVARQIIWRRTADVSGTGGGTLRMVQPAQGSVDADAANDDRAIIVDRPVRTREYDQVTQVIPVAGDARVTLFSCSDSLVTSTESAGFSVVRSGLGLYSPPYVQHDGAEAVLGALQRRVVFSEVTVESDNVTSIQEAADKLLKLTVKYLQDKAEAFTSWETERFVSPVDILPGQSITMVYAAPDYSGSWSSSDLLYTETVYREFTNEGDWAGIPLTRLSVTEEGSGASLGKNPGPRTSRRQVGRHMKMVERIAARSGSPTVVSLSVSSSASDNEPGSTNFTDNSITTPNTPLTTNSTGRLTLAELVVGAEDGSSSVRQEEYPMTVRSGAQFLNEIDARGGVTLTSPDDKSAAVLQRLIVNGHIRLIGRSRAALYGEDD